MSSGKEKTAERERSAHRLVLKSLPELDGRQRGIVVAMMQRWYTLGLWEEFMRLLDEDLGKIAALSRKGVEGRRKKSKRDQIVAAFTAAAAARRDVSIDELAKEHGVSRATAYRALASKADSRRG